MYGKRKFNKYTRKTRYHRRTYKGSYRSRGKGGRRLKQFRRNLNNVSEKKIFNATYASAAIYASTAAGAIGPGIMASTILSMVQGVASGQYIGSQIFLRYVRVRIVITNTDNTHYNTGHVGILVMKERKRSMGNTLTINQMLGGAGSYTFGTQDQLLKTHVKKFKLYHKKLQGPAALTAVDHQFPDPFYQTPGPKDWAMNFKFKVMKNVHIVAGGILNGDLPDVWVLPIYFTNPWCYVAANPANYEMKIAMTFSDN